MYKRLVALYVNYHIGITAYLLYGLLNTVGAALVVSACHHGLAAKGSHGLVYARVIGGHIGRVQHAGNLFVHALYDRLAA